MAERLCIVCGKIPTNHPSGKCVICMIEGKLPPQASQREMQGKENSKLKIKNLNMMKKEGGSMAVPKEKQCKVEGCEKYKWKGGMCFWHYNEAHGIEKRMGRKPKNSQVSLNQKNKAVSSAKSAAERGGVAEPESIHNAKERRPKMQKDIFNLTFPHLPQGNGNYIISIDFTAYPKLHDKLIQMADENFRDPGQQLLSMLHHTLKDAEART